MLNKGVISHAMLWVIFLMYEFFVNFETKIMQCHFLQITSVNVTSKYMDVYLWVMFS